MSEENKNNPVEEIDWDATELPEGAGDNPEAGEKPSKEDGKFREPGPEPLNKDKEDKEDQEDEEDDKKDQEDTKGDKDKEDEEGTPEEDSKDNDEDSEEDSEEDESGSKSVFEELNSETGYEVDTSDLKETKEDHAEYIKRVAKKMSKDILDRDFESMEDVKEYYEYRKNGGDPDSYFKTKFPERDYTQEEFDKENPQFQKEVLNDYLKQQGLNTKQINSKIKRYEESDMLEDEARDAYNQLKNVQKEEKDTLVERQKQENQKYQEQVNQHWESVKKTLFEGKTVNNVTIPEKEKDSFYKFMSEPVDNKGNTRADLVAAETDVNERIIHDWLLYNKHKNGNLDLSKAFKNLQSGDKEYATRLKKSINKDKQTKKSGPQSGRKTKSAKSGSDINDTLEEIDFDKIG